MNVAWSDLGMVLLVGLAVGAGVVALFAFGVAAASGASTDGETEVRAASPTARYVSWLCFAVCAVIVVYGIYLAIPSLHKLF